MNNKLPAAIQWLQKNQGNIKWKLVGPNIQNPFDVAASSDKLQEYVSDRTMLMEVCAVQAYMDETTIIKITDLNTFTFVTEHPNLIDIGADDLRRFLEASGTWKVIQGEVDKIQKACQAEIQARESSPSF